MTQPIPSVVFVSGALPLGGTSTFALNVCAGMDETHAWKGISATIQGPGHVGPQIRALGLECLWPHSGPVLHEERLENLLDQLCDVQPRALVAALGSSSFDMLRAVPEHCLRIGMIQSDDEIVYRVVEKYLPWLDAVAGVSREICRKMEARLGSRRIPVVHQPYGVPMSPMSTPRARNGPLRVLFLGRVIEEQKRVNLMARVMEKTLEASADLEWTIAGDGPDLGWLREHFERQPRVRFLGAIAYADVPHVLAEHEVYFLCSNYEGLPLSLLEAMGAGLVPVVSDLPSGISEVVNNRNGIRVAIDDELGYSNAVVNLAADPDYWEACSGEAAREVRESHSTVAMARRWEQMLDDLLPEEQPRWLRGKRVGASLEVENHWRFHPILRPVRSAAKRLRLWKRQISSGRP